MSTHAETAQDAWEAAQNSETGKATQMPASARKGGKTSEPRTIWRVILGLR